MRKIFSFDAETDGLWGNPFAIAATATSPDGVEIASFSARLGDHAVTNQWVKDNVLPAISNMPVTHPVTLKDGEVADVTISFAQAATRAYDSMLRDFARFYLEHKADAVVIAHCPTPVEAHLLRECHRLGFIGDWDGPYPLIGIEGLLDAAGEPATEATAYMTKHHLPLPEGSAHNPLYDCRLAAAMYRHLKGW